MIGLILLVLMAGNEPKYTKQDILNAETSVQRARRLAVLKRVNEATLPTQKIDPNRWKPYNTILEGAWWGANAGDAMTTNSVLRSGGEEMNPILGRHPTPGRVWGTALATGGLHTLGSTILDEPYRSIYQGLTLALKLYAMRHNIRMGGKIEF